MIKTQMSYNALRPFKNIYLSSSRVLGGRKFLEKVNLPWKYVHAEQHNELVPDHPDSLISPRSAVSHAVCASA